MQDASTAYPPHHRIDRSLPPFVGRDTELHALREALELSLSGIRQVVLVSGEPGIGKTATATQLAELAQECGSLVLWGQCYDWEGAPAYWPWTRILSAWLREFDDATVEAMLGPHAALLAQIVPAIQARFSALPPLPSLEPDVHRFQLLAAVATVVHAAAEHRPLVIVLDDAHWADVPTLQLLHVVAQEIRAGQLLLVVTYRDAEISRPHPGAAILADLARVPHCRRIPLRGLPKPQVARLVARLTGQAQSPALVEALYAETEGNPLFVTEVVHLLADEQRLDDGVAAGFRHAHVPVSVRAAIGRRLDRLSATCVQVLTIAAVIGRDTQVRLLMDASGLPARTILDAFDEAIRAEFIKRGEEAGSYSFGHALVQEALYQEASAADRARWHLAVAHALEVMSGANPPWAELAYHVSQAAPLSTPEEIERTARRAGDAAMGQFAWDAAATHYQHAMTALDQLRSIDLARRCDLLLVLGEAQNRSGSGAGDVPAARMSFLGAFELARQLSDGERMARAAIGYAGVNIVGVFGGPRQLELLEQASSALDPVDSPLRARVLARLAVNLWHRSADNADRSLVLADEALTVARRLGEPTLIAYALWARHSSGQHPGNLPERLTDANQLVVVAEQTDDPIAATWGYLLRLLDCLETADLFGAQQAMTWLRHFSQRSRIVYIDQRVAAYEAMLALLIGDYATAAAHVERARSLWQSDAPRQHAAQSFLLVRDLGEFAEAEDIQLPDHLHSWRRTAQAHRLGLALARGHLDAARADYEDLAADNFRTVRVDQHWYATLAPLAEAAVAFEDAPRAARLSAWLEPYAERLMVDGSLVVCHGPVSLPLGQLAGVLGHWDAALQHLDHARALCERLGLRPSLARALLAQAEVLARRAAPGDHAAARDLAQRASESASAIGMLGLLPATSALLEMLTPTVPTDFGLTPRERDVLRLIAHGLTDAEVAAQLFLSPRTVGTHLTSIYTKLAVSSRTAATRVAIERGLS